MKQLMLGICGLALMAGSAAADVFPTLPHAADNFIPFGAGIAGGTPTMHQVFASSLFSNATSGLPARITSIGFAPQASVVGQTFSLGQVTIRLGYANVAPLALAIPVEGGGGAPNASGPMTLFYDAPTTVVVLTGGPASFSDMTLVGTPFVYNPALGNLLVEIVVPSPTNTSLAVSRAAASAESTRSYIGMAFAANTNINATRMNFTFTPVVGCRPDLTTTAVPGSPGYGTPNGILNNDDFFYYLAQFAAGNIAVADLTTTAVAGSPGYGIPNGVLNNDDFFYYLAIFAAGC